MLHWTPARMGARSVTPIAALTATAQIACAPVGLSRADHARMLGHAATRRRAARGEDRGYWIACAPAALAKAAAIRTASGFARLP